MSVWHATHALLVAGVLRKPKITGGRDSRLSQRIGFNPARRCFLLQLVGRLSVGWALDQVVLFTRVGLHVVEILVAVGVEEVLPLRGPDHSPRSSAPVVLGERVVLISV